ncbi:MAG: hypothetical protein B5766_01360 [Candidatus Lumbricidophila eiseniae]|uniref:isochorismate synthase n=1 Tax=Candidatus Lumbricidiphila eiseniae TaxID=1969409 RepID=A0A2A6FUS3_9MICO|nr:MAG: hypothetical protein B5766_01360 [Candidatus Lumbricidophila eiseniae]
MSDPEFSTIHLRVRSYPVSETAPLIRLVHPGNPLIWFRGGEGIVGLGETLRLETIGTDRITRAASLWRRLAEQARIDDRVGLPGSGLVAFGTFAFADQSTASSVLVVPETIVGRRDGRSWVTRISRCAPEDHGKTHNWPTSCSTSRGDRGNPELPPAPPGLPESEPRGALPHVSFSPGMLPPEAYARAVANALTSITVGDYDKVVLARDLTGTLPNKTDLRTVITRLADSYSDTWVFAVDGLIGASPETLVRVDHGTVSSRVLAGTTFRGGDPVSDRQLERALVASPKNRAEHALAVVSAVESLSPHTARLDTSPEPFTLKLPNLWHLATDLKGILGDGSHALDLVAVMHPTAAVAGTPREAAVAAIADLEGFDRRRYAGPVGWIDGDGDGEWAIALRCAQIDPDRTITAYAGCGIVRESEPQTEVAETDIKFQPIRDAFGR